jgi:hypothetical protein
LKMNDEVYNSSHYLFVAFFALYEREPVRVSFWTLLMDMKKRNSVLILNK